MRGEQKDRRKIELDQIAEALATTRHAKGDKSEIKQG